MADMKKNVYDDLIIINLYLLFLGQWAKKTGLEHNQNVLNGTGMSMSSELKYKIADKVVFQKVKTALGKKKSFIGLILKLLNWLKAELRQMGVGIYL
jgi:hypothetical protein